MDWWNTSPIELILTKKISGSDHMSLFGTIKRKIKNGAYLQFKNHKLVLLKVETKAKKPTTDSTTLLMSHAKHLETSFPQLKEFRFELTSSNVEAVLTFYLDYIPLFHEPSRSSHTRTLLDRLKKKNFVQNDNNLINAINVAIAKSNLIDGLPDRAKLIKHEDQLKENWINETKSFEKAYGAEIISQEWPNADRGSSLLMYFNSHISLLKGKSILHFAPEYSLREWFKEQAGNLNLLKYHTIDGIREDVDEKFDIIEIKIPNNQFDVIICHRVLEHIPDDIRGLRELHRLLKPGGFMSFSVPQMPQREKTAEWVVPDESHDFHVRHYGADLVDRLNEVGFKVEVESWLLSQPREALLAKGAYPMKIYHCWK